VVIAVQRGRSAVFVVIAIAIAVTLATLTAGPASAAMAAPTGLTPTGSSADHTPLLSWNRVSGAVRYEVQATRDSDGSQVWSRVTTNHRASVTTRLPTGMVHWKVRGISASGVNGSWATSALSVTPQTGPIPVPPENDPLGKTPLSQPTDPPLLRWKPVSGASQYTIEVDNPMGLAAHLRTKGVPSASYYPKPLHQQTAYKAFPVATGSLPMSDRAGPRVISLPMHPYLEEATQGLIVDAVRGFNG